MGTDSRCLMSATRSEGKEYVSYSEDFSRQVSSLDRTLREQCFSVRGGPVESDPACMACVVLEGCRALDHELQALSFCVPLAALETVEHGHRGRSLFH